MADDDYYAGVFGAGMPFPVPCPTTFDTLYRPCPKPYINFKNIYDLQSFDILRMEIEELLQIPQPLIYNEYYRLLMKYKVQVDNIHNFEMNEEDTERLQILTNILPAGYVMWYDFVSDDLKPDEKEYAYFMNMVKDCMNFYDVEDSKSVFSFNRCTLKVFKEDIEFNDDDNKKHYIKRPFNNTTTPQPIKINELEKCSVLNLLYAGMSVILDLGYTSCGKFYYEPNRSKLVPDYFKYLLTKYVHDFYHSVYWEFGHPGYIKNELRYWERDAYRYARSLKK